MIWMLLACNGGEDASRFQLVEVDRVDQPTAASGSWIATRDAILLDGEAWDDGLPDGDVTFLDEGVAHVWGRGLYSLDGDPLGEGLANPTLNLLNPDAVPIALDIAIGEDTWLATAGGLFKRTTASSWALVDLSSSGSLNVLFTSVDTYEDRVVAGAILPTSIVPSEYAGLLSGSLFESRDGGDTWETLDVGSDHVTSVALDLEETFVGTLDHGVQRRVGEGEFARIPGSPPDIADLSWNGQVLVVGTLSTGAWLWDGTGWSQAGAGAVLGVGDGLAVTVDGFVYQVAEGLGPVPPEPAGSKVHVALSFHGNLYHSYRGDSPTDDGYGLDIDVVRNTLDWLDEHPDVHADWDWDNAWSTDLWLPQDAPDILEDISARVASGQDDVRAMSWNNGAMSAMTRPEFDEALARAEESNVAAFGEQVAGVQPQECMFSPDHVAWYGEQGIEWVTLFNAANGFTALREDVGITGLDAFNPVTLDAGGAQMTAVPVYHHADMLDHGGLLGWVQQLHCAYEQDTLLVIHFDADGETWENFDAELGAIESLDYVEFTTIADYLADHQPTGTYPFEGDVADGTGDGYQSWAEKDWNHRLYTQVQQSRDVCAAAELLGAEPCDLTNRLMALSTTNYGLAAPTLHADRVASATEQAAGALADADEALASVAPPESGTIELINPRPSTGPALIRVELPTNEDIVLRDGGTEIPWVRVAFQTIEFVVDMPAEDTLVLAWLEGTPTAEGEVPGVPDLPLLDAPFTECDGDFDKAQAGLDSRIEWPPRNTLVDPWEVATCDSMGILTRTLFRHDGLPGVVVDVEGQLGGSSPMDDLESVALTPFTCRSPETVTWRSFGGSTWTRPIRSPVETWNGQAADGWIELVCSDATFSITHRTTDRSSIAFAPMRVEDDVATVAPLGTLWGDGPWHEARTTGGHGIGDMVVPVVGSQFHPAAPDWAGQEVSYRLLVGEDIDPDVRDLFAHPPVVRVGD